MQKREFQHFWKKENQDGKISEDKEYFNYNFDYNWSYFYF